MSNTVKFVLSLGVILICGTLLFFFVLPQKNSAHNTAPTPPSESTTMQSDAFTEVPLLIDTEESITDQSAHLTINIHYPRVTLAGKPQLANEANDILHAFVEKTKEDFRKDVLGLDSPDIPKDFTSDLTMRFTQLLISPTIISIRFDSSAYIAGAAHPNNQVRILNYDFTKHLLLSPTDLFASSTQALPFLSTYSRTILHTMFEDRTEKEFTNQVLPGTEPTHENFQEIGITKEGLVVVFSPYQVAPYAQGTPKVIIPLQEHAALFALDVREAIRMAEENIVEGTPIE